MSGTPQPKDWTGHIVWPRAEPVPAGVEAAVYEHPAVVPYDFPSKDDVPVLLITSFRGKPLIEAHPNNKQARLEHIPICGTASHPDNGRILRLANVSMKLKEYSCVNVSKVHLVPRQHLVPYDRGQVHKLHKNSLKTLREAIRHLPHTKHAAGKHEQHGLNRGGDSKSEGRKTAGRVVVLKQHKVDKKKHKAEKPAPVSSNGNGVCVPAPNNQGHANGTGPGGGSRDYTPGGGSEDGPHASAGLPEASQGPAEREEGQSTGPSNKPGKTRSRTGGGSQRDTSSSLQSSPGIQRPLPPSQQAGTGKGLTVGPVDHNATGSGPEELPGTERQDPRDGDVRPEQDRDTVIQALHPGRLNWVTVLWCLPVYLFLFWVAYLALWVAGL